MKLKTLTINSGGKFNPDTTGPIVIDFSKSKMVGATGDEGQGKSTLLELFKMACGQNGGEKVIEALKNKDNNSIDVELEFVGNDKADYQVKIKDGKITVVKEGVTHRSGQVGMLKEQLGIVGTSPLEFKNGDIDDLVKWLADFSKLGADEFKSAMKKLKDGMATAKKARATANNAAKGCREYLRAEGLLDSKNEIIEKTWKENEKKFATEPDIKELSKKLTAAGTKSDKFIENESKVNSQKERKKQLDQQIKALQKELEQVESNITIGEEWLDKNKDAKKEYDAVKKQYDSAAQDSSDYNKWQEVLTKKKELDAFETAAIKADSMEKDLIKKQQELQWEVIPDIAGLEIVLEDTHEDEGVQKKAGFYINGMSSKQMSNTEFLAAIFKILKKNKVSVVVIDDASQFGTSLMTTLEGMVKSGCYVLLAEMSRGQQHLEIQYK